MENVEQVQIASLEIPSGNLSGLRIKIEEINKRARKLHAPEIQVVLGAVRVEIKVDEDTKIEYPQEYTQVSLVGEMPKLAGWELIAAITPLEGTGENLVRAVPKKECPAEFFAASTERCDHCHVKRQRNDVFVLKHKNGEHKVIGRNCLRDFLGTLVTPESMLNAASVVWDTEEMVRDVVYGGGGGFVPNEAPIEKFLGLVSVFVRKFGWTPRSAAVATSSFVLQPTVDQVLWFLFPWGAQQVQAVREFGAKHEIVSNEQDADLAKKALEWARALPKETNSNYLHNLRVASSASVVTYQTAGVVASAISAYKREVEREQIKLREKITKRRAHVGTVGVRQGFPKLTVLKVTSLESQWGVTTLIVFENEQGDLLKWFGSGDLTGSYHVGETVDVTATVKEHDQYKEINQTGINRVVDGIDPKKFDLATGLPLPKKSRKTKAVPSDQPAVV